MREREFHDGRADGLTPLESLDLADVHSFADRVRGMSGTAFGGRQLGDAFEILLEMAGDPDCRVVLTLTLPMPDPVIHEDHRLPASYANFYIANRRVLVPVFGDENDQTALETLQRLFPDRLVLGIDCTDLAWGLGAVHCVTQQQPAV